MRSRYILFQVLCLSMPYLRALITADLDIAPEDENGYRLALIEAFRARGIFPGRVNTLSVESLHWNRPVFTAKEQGAINWLADEMKPHIRQLMETKDRKQLYDLSRWAQQDLHDLFIGKKRAFLVDSEWENFLNKLGMTSRPVSQLFGKDSSQVRFLRNGHLDRHYIPWIEVHTVRPAFRAGREGRQIEQVLVTLTQRVTADVGKDGVRKRMIFRGGCSLILSLGDLNTVEYVIVKNIKSYRRFCQQTAYLNGEDESAPAQSMSMYADDDRDWRLNFNLLHRH